jgi:hypothetical protein
MSRKWIFSLAVAAAAIIPGVAASSAMATDVANCQYSGNATTTPGVGVGPNTGNYTFTSLTFTCATSDNSPSNSQAETDVVTLPLTSSGTFNNTACGTGTADGVATAGTATDELGKSHVISEFTGTTLHYDITFAGGEGVLTSTTPNGATNTNGAGDTITAAGNTSITPSGGTDGNGNATPNATYCTATFAVAGDVTIQASNETDNP